MKSIKARLIISTLSIFIVVSIVVSAVSAFAIYSSTLESLKATMIEASSLAATGISKQLEVFDKILAEVGSNSVMVGRSTTETDKVRYLASKTAQYAEYGCTFFFADNKAHVYGTQLNISDRDFYKAAQNGEHFLSAPLIRKDTGKLSFSYAIPVERLGIIYMMFNYEALYQVVENAAIGKSGGAYVLNSAGETVINSDQQMVVDRHNTAIESKSDPTLVDLAGLESKAAAGGNGFGTYKYGGISKILAYAPISGTQGWTFLVTAAQSEFMGGLYKGIIMSITGCVLSAIISIFIMILLAGKIVNPMKRCIDRLKKLAAGDLTSPVPIINTKDETKDLADSTEIIVGAIRKMILDIENELSAIGSGDFTVRSADPSMYVGDFSALLTSITQITSNLSTALAQINIASDQVSSGSEQVSSGAQALSQGAAEQASSVEELAATINEISEQVTNNADHAKEASIKTATAGQEVTDSNQKMQQLIDAMSEISTSSQEIGKVIKVIEDIAFQTNILALNAAVEAARAGAAGKGFAVVADEVRNLASKSAEAAKGTTALIEHSVKAVERGTGLADDTAKSLLSVVNSTRDASVIVDKIADASRKQASSIAQVTLGIDQISAVVQTNSATAEESAAASEELSGQATMLRRLVSEFKLEQEETVFDGR